MIYLGILIAAFAISKELYVFNEETLIAIVFFVFIAYLYSAISGMIVADFEDRIAKIAKEFGSSFTLRTEMLTLLVASYKKQIELLDEIPNFVSQTRSEIAHLVALKRNELQQKVGAQLVTKLAQFQALEMKTNEELGAKLLDLITKEATASFYEQEYDEAHLIEDIKHLGKN